MTKKLQPNITNEILNGDLIKLMFKLSIPGIMGMLLIGLNTFVDALCAGQLIGETALAAISLAIPLTSIVIGCAMSVGVGSASVLSQAIGSGDTKTQSKIFGNLIIISVIVSSLLTILGYSFGKELIALMGGEGEVASYGADFFKTYMLSSIFLVIAVSSSQLIKAEGKIALATLFAGIYVIVNCILNPIFVLSFNLGIQGIALATVVSAIVYSLINCSYFFCGKSSIPVNPKKLTLSLDLLPAILSVGGAVMFMQVVGIVQQIVLFKAFAHYGTDSDIAFGGATIRLFALVTTPLYGFVQALNPVIGMSYGARDYKRIKNAYLTFAVGGSVFLILLWIPLQLEPKMFLRWLIPDFNFTYNDLLNFRIVIFFIPISSFISCSIALFQSIGNGKIVGFITILKQIILFVPMVLILPIFFGVNGIYYSAAFVEIVASLIVAVVTWRELRKVYFKLIA
ncbi:MATE family efflux transporter [Iningainema tapete]|uniref:Multidrug export protein MepA n=1 Tax=Iningainema tapete BLCC-T55 TaxID=2748662 RepID=A0A8J6XFM2_9CYAN|nr:MATE family efflux transporter [Iningainema tapete]MBD2775775.1 MATE family efflux transporter [Iningainema tapete BLCC-T55]